MKKKLAKTTAILCMLVVCGLVLWKNMFGFSSTPQLPNLAIDGNEHNFGVIDGSQRVEHLFILQNKGNSPLEVKGMRFSCGCTGAKLESPVILPGESCPLRININPEGRQGDITAYVALSTNDPKQPSLILKLKAQIVQRFRIVPANLSFDELIPNSKASISAQLHFVDPALSFRISEVQTDLPGILGSAELDPGGRSYTIRLTTAPPLKIGPFRTTMIVKTDNVQYPTIQVPVEGNVVGELKVWPLRLEITEENLLESKPIFILVGPGELRQFKIEDVHVSGLSIQSEIQDLKEKGYVIVLRNLPDPRILHGRQVLIKTTALAMRDIVIPISVTAGDASAGDHK
jgi:hypothetical protein